MTAIPAPRLERQIPQPQMLDPSSSRLLSHLHIIMPERIIPLLHDLRGRLKVAGSVWSEPEKRRIAARLVGDGEPFVEGFSGCLPLEGGGEAEGVDCRDGLPGVWVGV